MILYLIYGLCMVTCTVSPLSRLTTRLRIFHVCHNETFRNRYLSFYWKKWFYIWYVALAWWLVPCLPFPGLLHIYFLFTVCLKIFHVFTAFSGNKCWDIYKFDTNERVGVFLARRSVQYLVVYGIMCLFTILMLNVCGVTQSLW